jgi:resuscitation-promoting factor RpfB
VRQSAPADQIAAIDAPRRTTGDRAAARFRQPSSRLRQVAAHLGVLAIVAGGTSAFAVMHKTVTVDVDGHVMSKSAFGRTIGDVLAGSGVPVASRDRVQPPVDSEATDGEEIVVRHAHRVVLEIDGKSETVWTTALTVGEALDALGSRTAGAQASASRSDPLGRDGALLRVSTAKTIHVVDGATTTDTATNASTVRDALRAMGVVLGASDRVSVPLETTLVDGIVIVVSRVTTTSGTQTVVAPYATQQQNDPKLPKGTTVVAQVGHSGTAIVTFEADLIGDQEVARRVLSRVLVSDPVDQIVRVGSAALPVSAPAAALPVSAPAAAGTSQAIGQELAAARGWTGDQWACLDNLWARESGWRVNAGNLSSGAFGIPQALPGSKMATIGADWQTNPATQITWGLNYIAGRYATPCVAWAFWSAHNWY